MKLEVLTFEPRCKMRVYIAAINFSSPRFNALSAYFLCNMYESLQSSKEKQEFMNSTAARNRNNVNVVTENA